MLSRRALLAVIMVMIAVSFPASARADSATYTVQLGDTLNSIAATYGISAASIAVKNGLTNADLIQVGQSLALPAGAPAAAVAPAAVAADPAVVAASDVSSPDAIPSDGTYIVKRGDTLARIAQRYGTTIAALMRANNLKNPDRIYTGMRLTIPGGTTSGGAVGGTAAKGAGLEPTRLMVSIAGQSCVLVVNNAITGSWPCSTGRAGSPTMRGSYHVQSKMPVAYGATWGYYLPYWLGIYYAGNLENGIHGLPYNKFGFRDWGNKIGTPISFGCIVLQDAAAKKIYDTAWVGMQVVIQ